MKLSRFVLGLVLSGCVVLQEPGVSTEQSVESTIEDDLLFIEEYDTTELQKDLDKIQKAKLNCFYVNGINNNSLLKCMGQNFSKVDQSFLNYYKEKEAIMLKSFEDSIEEACEVDVEPCFNLKQVAALAMRNKLDPVDALEASVKPALESEGVNKAVLKFQIQKFANQFGELDHSKTIIIEFARETVGKVKVSIKESKIAIRQDYLTYQPNQLFASLGLMINPKIKTTPGKRTINWGEDEEANASQLEEDPTDDGSQSESQETAEASEGEQDLFNFPLLDEVAAKRMVSFYLSNPRIDLERIDFTKMPSEILEDINDLLKNKKVL